MPQINPAYLAGGDINTSRFVKWDLGSDFSVVEGTANSKIIGISQTGSKEAPIPSASTLAASNGQPLRVHGATEVTLLELGGTVVAGDDLKSDANGKGVVIAGGTTTQEVGALALQAGVSGEKILVQVTPRAEGQTAVSS